MIVQKKINISVRGSSFPQPIRVVEGDTVIQLILKYIDFDIPDGAIATMFAKKPSGNFVFQEDNINISGNVVTIDVENQTIIEDGIVPFQVELKKDEDILTTFINFFDVEKNLKNPNAEKSKTMIKAFDDLVAQKLKELEGYVPDSGGIDTSMSYEELEKIVSDYMENNPIEVVSEEQLMQAIEKYLTENPIESEKGDDGFSPIATVERTDSGARISIQDINGTTTVEILHGKKGDKGDKGADGTGVTILGSYASEDALKTAHPTGSVGDSYLVNGNLYVWSINDNNWINVGNIKGEKGDDGDDGISCTHSWNGTTLTVTSASGTSSVDLKGDAGYTPQKGVDYFDGQNGKDGKDGVDGKTPVKGTDYFTTADKNEMVNLVINALPTWQGGSY